MPARYQDQPLLAHQPGQEIPSVDWQTCCGSAPFLLWFWIKSTRPCTTVFTATNPFSSCSHVGGGASVGKDLWLSLSSSSSSLINSYDNCQLIYDFTFSKFNEIQLETFQRHLRSFIKQVNTKGRLLPGLGSILASSSKCGRSLLRLAGSPVLCRAIVSSWTLWAKEAGVCSYKVVGKEEKKMWM